MVRGYDITLFVLSGTFFTIFFFSLIILLLNSKKRPKFRTYGKRTNPFKQLKNINIMKLEAILRRGKKRNDWDAADISKHKRDEHAKSTTKKSSQSSKPYNVKQTRETEKKIYSNYQQAKLTEISNLGGTDFRKVKSSKLYKSLFK